MRNDLSSFMGFESISHQLYMPCSHVSPMKQNPSIAEPSLLPHHPCAHRKEIVNALPLNHTSGHIFYGEPDARLSFSANVTLSEVWGRNSFAESLEEVAV